jgi:glycosyltransferase involved in cell wall biosynthesis
MPEHKIIWLFRKRRTLGNFSIENSFRELRLNWKESRRPDWKESSFFSEGLLNRMRIISETATIKAEILHITGDIHFAALGVPKWKHNRPKLILTIHDLGFLEEFNGVKKWLLRKFWLHWPLRNIDHVITVSKTTKKAVLREVPWFAESNVSVIPTVVPQHFEPRPKLSANSKPVALHIGVASNKNLERHAEALRNLNVHLRIIGEPNHHQLEMLRSKAIDFSCASKLSDEGMKSEYTKADFLLFASTLEGFGMPIIEANMVGVPVITSDREPMKSVAGEAALLCNPLDAYSIRSAIQRILDDKPLQNRLIQIGFENAKRFSPEKSALLHQELYNTLTHAQS